MKKHRLRKAEPVRCMAWHACNRESCNHHPIHEAWAHEGCVTLNPFINRRYAKTQFCPKVQGYVRDIPLHEIDSNVMNDPNLAFRMKKSRKRG